MSSCLSDPHRRRPLAAALCLLAVVSDARAEARSWRDLLFAGCRGRSVATATLSCWDRSVAVVGPVGLRLPRHPASQGPLRAARADDAPDAPAGETWRLGLSVGGAYRYGPVRGYLQTPSGGAPGSTSLRRPTFKELDIDAAASGRFRLSAETGRHRVYLGVDPLSVSGTSVLGAALATQGLVFPAGTRVRASARLDLYRIGYQYRLCLGDERPCALEIAPTIEAAAFDFSYRLRPAAGGPRAKRNYREETPRLGIEATWFATENLTVSGRVVGSVPIEDMVTLWTAEVEGRYVLWRGGPAEVTAGAGVGFEYVDYEDSQTVPNHIRVEYGPAVVLTLRVAF